MLRAAAWRPLVGAAVATVVGMEVSRRTGASPGASLQHLRLLTVALAGASAFVVEDPAAPTLATSPTPLWVRTACRVVPAAAVASVAWWAAAWRTGLFDTARTDARTGLALEGLVLLVAALAVGASGHRRWPGGGGVMAGALTPGLLYLLAVTLPAPWSPLPGAPVVPEAVSRLLADLGVAAAVLMAAGFDPVRRWPAFALRGGDGRGR